MREAPSLVIIDKLLEKKAKVIAYYPVSIDEAKRRLGDKIEYANDMYEPLNDADALLLVTEWTEFRLPDWDLVKKLMKTPLVLDGRNIYDAREMKQKGFFIIV